MLTRLFSFLIFSSCAFGASPSPFAHTLWGSRNFDEHVMIYGFSNQQFVAGIVFPRDTLTSMSSTEVPEPRTTIKLKSGITLAFATNEVTVTQSTNKVQLTLKPQTIYLMQGNLSTTSSTDLSGIRLVPRRVWSRWVNDYVTTHDLELPDNLPKRFGKRAF